MGEDRPNHKDDTSGPQTTEKDVLVVEYQEVREELRENVRLLHTRVSRGIAAIGAVIGYALLAKGGSVFISIIPIIIGFIYLLSLNSIQNMLALGRRSYDIEEKVMPEGEGWEHQYGGLLPHHKRETAWQKYPRIDLSALSSIIVGVFSSLVYLGFCVLSLLEINEIGTVAGIDPVILLFEFYVIFTLFLIAAFLSYRRVYSTYQPDNI